MRIAVKFVCEIIEFYMRIVVISTCFARGFLIHEVIFACNALQQLKDDWNL